MEQPKVATLIGDVVASREDRDREELQRYLRAAFERVNRDVSAVQPLTMTIGDEFQAAYRSMAAAFEAQLRLTIGMVGRATLRVGLGWGAIRVFDFERLPLEQDGEGWWRARDALGRIEEAERGYGSPSRWRTAVVSDTARDSLLNGYLMLRDHLLGDLDEVDAAIVQGMLAGESFTAIADRLGLNKSSVSRRASSHGLTALVASRPEVVDLADGPDDDGVDA